MKSKARVILTVIMVFTLILTSSMVSLAFAKDRIQARDRDCIDDPNYQYCVDADCDQDRLMECEKDCDYDCIKDRLRKKLMDWDYEHDQDRLRLRDCLVQILLINLK